MVVSNRKKKKKPKRKKLPIDKKLATVSSILVGLGTIGFPLLNYCVQSRIDEFKISKSDYLEKQMMSFDFINKSNYNIKDSYILDDHYHIIKLLDSKNKFLLDSIEYKEIQVLGNASHNALNSAISSEQVDGKDADLLSRKIYSLTDSFKSEKELLKKKLIKEKLSDIYFDYNKKGASGTIDIQKNIDKIDKNISKYKKIKNGLWPFFLVCQSFGLLLGIWSNLYKRGD
ncbi:hypothetical protein JW879_00010 [candidate division WOR-3 bacterium]|nr:hypothetical protein [candidate division WOR-3 bacterium]